MENSFFEKLKKGMGLEEKKISGKKTKTPEIKEISIKEIPIEFEIEKEEIEKEKKPKAKIMKKEKIKIEKSKDPQLNSIERSKEDKKAIENEKKWPISEGQLAIDVYQTESDLVIQSAIAGVELEDLDISIEGDLVTIRGKRERPFEKDGDYFSQECYWGYFSRQIILPVEVDPNRVDATLKQGILTIRIPKILREKKRKIVIKG